MKNLLSASCLALCALLASSLALAAPRVAVMDFENRSGIGDWRVGRGAADILTTELVKSTKFEMYERERLNSMLNEQDLGQSGRVDPASAAKIGKLLGVQYMITGAVTEYGESSSNMGAGGLFEAGKKGYFAGVDIRIVDVNTGRILMAESGQGIKSSKNVRVMGIGGGERWNEKHATEAMRLAIKEVADKIGKADFAGGGGSSAAAAGPVDILIADVDGKTITLNQGKGAGLSVGDVLTVKRKGKEIKDPSTGAVLRVTYDTLGTVRLTEVDASYSVGTIASGSGFSAGDKAEK
jgi:curli biogenesis system outer membrane secretion channel CsgG